jgi:hypothetical protein
MAKNGSGGIVCRVKIEPQLLVNVFQPGFSDIAHGKAAGREDRYINPACSHGNGLHVFLDCLFVQQVQWTVFQPLRSGYLCQGFGRQDGSDYPVPLS